METKGASLWWCGLLMALSLVSTGCLEAVVGEIGACTYDEKPYDVGDKFTARDGCNSCVCGIDGTVSCTERACDGASATDDASIPRTDAGPATPVPTDDAGAPGHDAGPGTPVPTDDAGAPGYDAGPPTPTDAGIVNGLCMWEGKLLKAGETFLDVCRKCWCAPDGKVQCDPIECMGECWYDGKPYAAGASFPSIDGCNTCGCQAGGLIACTERACAPATCERDGKLYKPGESVPGASCESCGCDMAGTISCKPIAAGCGGSGLCMYEGTQRKPGEAFVAADGCNKCFCQMDGTVTCSSDTCMGPTCTLNGELHKFGELFYDELRCNSCSCTMDGGVACTARACDERNGCKLGDTQFASGVSITCEDGCNSCLCTNGTWSSTDRACGAPAKIERCDGTASEMIKANVVYLSGDRLLVDANFVGCQGSAPNVKLCWDGSFLESNPVQAQLRVSAGAPSTCTSWVTQQAMFDLTPLRDAYRTAYQSQQGQIILRLYDSGPTYAF